MRPSGLAAALLVGAATAVAAGAAPPTLPALPSPAPPTATPQQTIRGLVLARGTRAPVPLARLTARAQDGSLTEAESDGAGRFVLANLGPGEQLITVDGSAIERATFRERLRPGDASVEVVYYVPLRFETRYRTTVRGAQERVEVARTLGHEELARLPGTGGDALRAVENLPGMGRSPLNLGLFIVRGGKPTDSRAFLQGTEVPQLYHFGGFTSVIPAHLVERIDYLPGGFPVRYGRAIAGVIDVDLRPGRRDRLHGHLDTNAFDTGVSVEGPVGRGSFVVAARRSYVDALLGATAAIGWNVLGEAPLRFTSAPVYWDYQALLDYPLGGGRFRLALFGSDDDLRLVFAQPTDLDPSVRGVFRTRIFFHRLQLRYTRSLGAVALLGQLSGGYTKNQGSLGVIADFAIDAAILDARLEARYTPLAALALLVGADAQASIVWLAADVPLPPEEGKLPLPPSVAPKFRRDDRLLTLNLGLYAEATLKLRRELTLAVGARFDYWSALRRQTFAPRLTARWQAHPLTAVRGAIGLFTQDPQPFDYDAVFGNPRLRPESALHTSLTVEQSIWRGITLELAGFYKQLFDLVAPSTGWLAEGAAVVPERRSSDGGGRIYGVEVLLRQALSTWLFGWLSYTLMASERLDPASGQWRRFDFDQTHVLVLSLSASLPRGFGAGLRFRYTTGLPYTAARGGQLDADAGVYTPVPGPANAARLDAFHALDLRFDKTFTFQRWLLKVYLEVTNVYNRSNPEQMQYSFDYTRTQPLYGLPILPSFGLRGEF